MLIPFGITGGRRRRLLTVATTLCIASLYVYLVSYGMAAHVIQGNGLVPIRLHSMESWALLGVSAQLIPLIVYPFLHAGLIHVVLNLWGLWIFGGAVEKHMNRRFFVAVWVSATVVTGLTYTAIEPDAVRPLIGASGGVAAMLGVCITGLPDCRVKVWRIWTPNRVSYDHPMVYMMAWIAISILGFILDVDHYRAVSAAVHGSGLLWGLIVGYWTRGTQRTLVRVYDSVGGANVKKHHFDLAAGTSDFYVDTTYYDHEFKARQADARWYADAYVAADGPVLELAVGTGRIALKAVRQGAEVVGLDLSAPMLEKAIERRHSLPKSKQGKLHLARADMRHFELGCQFQLITCPFNAFMHLYTRQDAEACLRSVKKHLAPGGRFIVDILMADFEYLLRSPFKRIQGLNLPIRHIKWTTPTASRPRMTPSLS